MGYTALLAVFALHTSVNADPSQPGVYTSGHGDIGLVYEDNELNLHLHLGEGDSAIVNGVPVNAEFEPEDVIVSVSQASQQTVSNPALAHTGVPVGQAIWILPATNQPGLPFLGFGTEELAASDWIGDLHFRLVSVTSPSGNGYFSIYQSDGLGDFVFHMSNFDGGVTSADKVSMAAGSHDHHYMAFSELGIWQIAMTVDGVHVNDGPVTSATKTITFLVAGQGGVLAVDEASGAPMNDGQTINFGAVGIGGLSSMVLTIRNSGGAALTGLAISKDGTHAPDFAVSALSATELAPDQSIQLTITASPTTRGDRTAAIHLQTEEPGGEAFDINLVMKGIKAEAPLAKSLAATNTFHNSATLNGMVTAKSDDRAVLFEYGLTNSLGSTVLASPVEALAGGVTNVSAQLTGLSPHTKYYYRVRAFSELGAGNGAIMIFTTQNRNPLAENDTLRVLPQGVAALNVLANDSDADGDALYVGVVKAVVPATAGTVKKVGNQLLFTARSSFTGATIQYTAADKFGGSYLAQVNVLLGSATIDPALASSVSARTVYDVAVTADGAWAVVETLPWVTVAPASGFGNGSVTVTVLPNASKTARSGKIRIAGQEHVITQAGVTAPSLDAIADQTAIVGNLFSLDLGSLTYGMPVTYQITNTPPGLKIDHATGTLSGIPTKSGNHAVRVKVTNAALAGANNERTFFIRVLPLSSGIVGVFHGVVERNPAINGNLGSRLELAITTLGSYTGKLITGAASMSFSGKLQTSTANPDSAGLDLIIPRKSLTALNLKLTLDGVTETVVDGVLKEVSGPATAEVAAWHNGWNKSNLASPHAGLHTFSLDLAVGNDALPQGFGYGSFAVKESDGSLKVAGLLSDGTSFSSSTFVGKQGQVLVYQSLYSNGGSLLGFLDMTGHEIQPGQNSDMLSWFKPVTSGVVYPGGFGPVNFIVEGGSYTPPAKGAIVLGLSPPATASTPNASLSFFDGDPMGNTDFGIDFRLINPTSTGVTNTAMMPHLNPNAVKLTKITPATGHFSGEFTLPAAAGQRSRKALFQGQIVNHPVSGPKGVGYFLLPQASSTTAPKLSGAVILQSTPPP